MLRSTQLWDMKPIWHHRKDLVAAITTRNRVCAVNEADMKEFEILGIVADH